MPGAAPREPGRFDRLGAGLAPTWAAMVAATLLGLVAGADQAPAAYRVTLRHTFTVWGDVKAGACGGGCSEGHDCTACVGVRVFDGEAVVATEVFDKTPCCSPTGPVATRLNVLSLLSPWCGAHSCPSTPAAPATVGPFPAELTQELGCVAAGEPLPVRRYTAVLGGLSNNAIACGSRCSATDPFTPFDPSTRQDEAFGGFVAVCPSDDPAVLCQPVARCPDPAPPPAPAAAREGERFMAPTRWGGRQLRAGDRWLARTWALRRRFF